LSNEHEEGGTGPCIVILTNCWGSTNKFGVKKGNDWCRALSANEIYLLYRDAYPTNRSGFSLGTSRPVLTITLQCLAWNREFT
jgi:hypothetical protein